MRLPEPHRSGPASACTPKTVFKKYLNNMKNALKWALLALLLTAGGALQAQVRFETGSTDELHAKALKLRRPVLIDLYADRCQPCRMMEQQVFSRKEVGEFINSRFVAARYDIEQATGRALMRRYGSGSIPLLLVFSPQGALLGRITGASSAQKLLRDLQRILDNSTPSKEDH